MNLNTYPQSKNKKNRLVKLSKYFVLSFATIFVVIASLLIFAKPADAAITGCKFENSFEIKCVRDNQIGEQSWFFSPAASRDFGVNQFLIFVRGDVQDSEQIWVNTLGDGSGVYVRKLIAGGTALGITSNSTTVPISDLNEADERQDEQDSQGRDICNIFNMSDCEPKTVDEFDTTPPYNSFYQDSLPISEANIVRYRDLIRGANAGGDCIDSPLSFILCPLINFWTEALVTVLETFTDYLKNPVVEDNSQLQAALSNIINLANTFYTLIFLFIILANFIAIPGLDNYNIKKLLPKFIAAVILTQFTPLICSLVLDLGNVLGVILPTYLLNAFNISGTPAEAFAAAINPFIDSTGTISFDLGEYLLFSILIYAAVIVGLVALVYIVARFLFLVVLVLASPLAFAAWVLPKTETFFKQWWSWFIKLSIMFLLINLLFAAGVIFQKLLSDGLFGGGATGFLADVISALVPLIVLILIPKTLKASTAVVGAATQAFNKNVTQPVKDSRVGKATAKSAQEGKLAEVKGGAQNKFGQSTVGQTVLGKKRAARLEAKGAALKDKGGEKLKQDVESLDLHRRIDLATKKGPVADAAKASISKKRRELANIENIDADQLTQLEYINAGGNVGVAQAAVRTKLGAAGVLHADQAVVTSEGKLESASPNLPIDKTHIFKNPHHFTPPAPGGTPAGGGPGGGGPPAPPPAPPGPPSPPPGGGAASDIRLKKDIVYLQTLSSGINLYRFKYIWDDTEYVGVMAQEILGTHPQAVMSDTLGFYRVDYKLLGIQMVPYTDWVNNQRSVYRVAF